MQLLQTGMTFLQTGLQKLVCTTVSRTMRLRGIQFFVSISYNELNPAPPPSPPGTLCRGEVAPSWQQAIQIPKCNLCGPPDPKISKPARGSRVINAQAPFTLRPKSSLSRCGVSVAQPPTLSRCIRTTPQPPRGISALSSTSKPSSSSSSHVVRVTQPPTPSLIIIPQPPRQTSVLSSTPGSCSLPQGRQGLNFKRIQDQGKK